MALYTKDEIIPISGYPSVNFTAVEDVTLSEEIDGDLISLEEHMLVHDSLTTVKTSTESNSFNFLDNTNKVLFNEYISSLTRNLGVNLDNAIATESIMAMEHSVKHHQLALEGIVANIWNSIKRMFTKIGGAIKEFFKRHFTRLGVVKKRLDNLQKSLEKTDKDIKQITVDKIPGKINSAFPYEGSVNESSVKESIELAKKVSNVIKVVNEDAHKTAKKSVMNKDFVARIKAFTDEAKEAGDSIKEQSLMEKGKDLVSRNKSETYKNNEKMSTIKENAERIKEDMEGELSENASGDELTEETGSAEAKKELQEYFSKIAEALEPLKGKKLPGGKVLEKAEVSENSGIELEFDTVKDKPSDLGLGSRTSILSMVKDCLKVIEGMEKTGDEFGKVNDMILDNINTVDKLITELDKLSGNVDAPKYKKKLEFQVKERLAIMRNFFTNYNKINKNFMSMVLDVSEGVIVYSTTSMKHFG